MPTYEYKCKNCGYKCEFIESIKSIGEWRVCPKCNKRKLQRIISKETGANIIFKGEGFYRSTDYINQKAKEDGILHTKRRKKKESL